MAGKETAGYVTDVQLQSGVVVRRVGQRESSPTTFLQQDLDVLPGQELHPLAGRELDFDDHHVARGARHFLHAHRQGLDRQVARRTHFADFDVQVAPCLGAAEQGETVASVVFAQRVKLRFSMVNLAAQHLAPARSAGSVPAAVRQDHSLAQGGVEDGLVDFGGKAVRPGLNVDLESHQNSLRVDSGKIVR